MGHGAVSSALSWLLLPSGQEEEEKGPLPLGSISRDAKEANANKGFQVKPCHLAPKSDFFSPG